MIHNNGWQIIREHAAEYYVIPPAAVDPKRQRIPMPSKNRAYRRALIAS
jgi:hypothetical protein